MEQIVRATFQTHYYIRDGQLLHQQSGAPMGLNGSGPTSRVMMDLWVTKVRQVETKSQIMAAVNPVIYERQEINLLKKYVDDFITALQEMRRGARWDQGMGVFIWSPEAATGDKQTPLGELTMEVFCTMATSLIPCLKFNWDCLFWTL